MKAKLAFHYAGEYKEIPQKFRTLGCAIAWWITRHWDKRTLALGEPDGYVPTLYRLLDIAHGHVVFFVANGNGDWVKPRLTDIHGECVGGVEYVCGYSNPVPGIIVGNDIVRLPKPLGVHDREALKEIGHLWPEMYAILREAYAMVGIPLEDWKPWPTVAFERERESLEALYA